MAMTEDERYQIRESLTEVHGEQVATILMKSIPAIHWHELATKSDLAEFKNWVEGKFEAQSVLMSAEFTKVAAEFTAVRGELAEKIGELHEQIGALYVAMAESSQKTSDKLDSMRRWVVGSVVAVVGAVVGSGVWLG
ncbi:MAG: hypothetical protein OXN44_06910 [Acidimicrobiaceae bacterium]|nr:hypothetical protein [Acidimicrobiaceae bacterium]